MVIYVTRAERKRLPAVLILPIKISVRFRPYVSISSNMQKINFPDKAACD